MQTRDEFLESGKGKSNIKPDHPNKNDLYRRIGIIGANDKGNLIIVKLTTKGKHKLSDNKSTFKPIVETKDNMGNFIKIQTSNFVLNSKKRSLSNKDVSRICKDCFVKSAPETRRKNIEKARELKGRK